jgi:hypothetical protein
MVFIGSKKESHQHEADGLVWIQYLSKNLVNCACTAALIAREISLPHRFRAEIAVESTLFQPA